MGNHIACIHSLPPDVSPDRTIKVIRPDGRVRIYHRPIPASHLMLQFPKHLICHSDSFFIGKKIPSLSNSDYLLLGNKYFLLPTHFFQSVLSFVTVASIASSTFPSSAAAKNKPDFVKNIAACRLFDVHKTPSGTLQIRVSDEFIARLVEEGQIRGEEDEEEGEMMTQASEKKQPPPPKGRVCTTPELEKDYTRLVGCRREREWKPKLETIREKEKKKLAKKLSALAMKKMKRRKKSHVVPKGSQKTSKTAEKLPPPPPPPPPPHPLPLPKASKKSKIVAKLSLSRSRSRSLSLSPPPPPPPPPPPTKASKKSKKAEKLSLPPPSPPPPPPPLTKASKKSKKAEKLPDPPIATPPPPPQLNEGTEKQQTTSLQKQQQQQQHKSKKSKKEKKVL